MKTNNIRNINTVLPRKERHAGISEGDHFHENGLMVLYRHAGIKRDTIPRKFLCFFLHFLYHSNMSNTYEVSFQKYYFQVEVHMSITSNTKTCI